jgi:hypothetical protein
MNISWLQLIALGIKDEYISPSPKINFYKVTYRKNENFLKEENGQDFRVLDELCSSSRVMVKRKEKKTYAEVVSGASE